ncbi:hypothetical protein A7A09_019175 [Paracoccus methylarcula]|uniref:Uncharacterized protein n=1 Tax=Paracoccus methylarcula TaxID=72022 RepID=A0A3R7M780_9RHOB|nr:hypothetical protein A7A09_019175 [Paracoccus methylarcula]
MLSIPLTDYETQKIITVKFAKQTKFHSAEPIDGGTLLTIWLGGHPQLYHVVESPEQIDISRSLSIVG